MISQDASELLQLGEEHERTKESSECLKHLTQQAVTFQKKMNEIVKGEKNITFSPLQVGYILLLIHRIIFQK